MATMNVHQPPADGHFTNLAGNKRYIIWIVAMAVVQQWID